MIIKDTTQTKYQRYDGYTVAIFGSARLEETHQACTDTYNFAKELATLPCNVVTGGGLGVMVAANQGLVENRTSEASAKSIGLHITLPFEVKANPFIDDFVLHESFFTRLNQFTYISDAFVAFDGGIGTLLEIVAVLQLIQVGKIEKKKLILVGDMWVGLLQWITDSMIRDDASLIGKKDLQLIDIVNDYHEAFEVIKKHKAELNI